MKTSLVVTFGATWHVSQDFLFNEGIMILMILWSPINDILVQWEPGNPSMEVWEHVDQGNKISHWGRRGKKEKHGSPGEKEYEISMISFY